MKTPKASAASVIIPAYNSESTIQACLQALKNQTTQPLEIIVVDDGSRDATIRKAEALGARVISQAHSGPASARNRGAREARGDILLFTDADCVPDRDWVREMLRPLQDPEIKGVQGSYTTSQPGLVARFAQAEIEDRYERLSSGKYIDFIGTYSAAYRKDIFLKFRGFDQGFPEASGEDPELSFRLSRQGHMLIFNPGARVSHSHPDTLGKYLRQKFSRARWRVLLYKKHPKKMVRESYTPQGLKAQIGLFYLFVLGLIASLFQPQALYLSLACLVLLFITTLPFSIRAGRKGKGLGLASPLILILRSIAFSLGLAYGVLGLAFVNQGQAQIPARESI
jgi:glycosyltransferase involved in cell wall biosynthesis